MATHATLPCLVRFISAEIGFAPLPHHELAELPSATAAPHRIKVLFIWPSTAFMPSGRSFSNNKRADYGLIRLRIGSAAISRFVGDMQNAGDTKLSVFAHSQFFVAWRLIVR